MRASKLTIVLAAYFLVIGCAPETPTSTVEPGRLTSTATVIASPTAAKTPTLIPQSTALPVETPYPTPETPLSADGPWLVFIAALIAPEDGYEPPHLWAMNADGTGLTLLDPDPVETFIVRPDNIQDSRPMLVYITHNANDYFDLTLKSITLPDLEKTAITPLVGSNEVVDVEELLYAFNYSGWYLWTSDGNTLVFIGLMDRKWSDIYTYDFTTKTITRLTGDDSIDYDESNEEGFYGTQGHTCCLQWSPDERYVIYEPFSGLFRDILWVGPWERGLAAARVGGGRDFTMINISARFKVFGWYSPNEILLQDGGLADWDPASGVYAFNLDTGESTTIIDEAVPTVAYAEEHETWLYTLGLDQSLILYKDGITTALYNPGIDSYDYLRWSDEDNAFTNLKYLITLDGRVSQVVRTPTPTPALWAGEFEPRPRESPDGTLWAWVDYSSTLDGRFRDAACGIWVGTPDSVPSEVFAFPEENYGNPDHILLDRAIWSPDSQRLIYLTDHGIFVAERPNFEPVLIAQVDGWDLVPRPWRWVEK